MDDFPAFIAANGVAILLGGYPGGPPGTHSVVEIAEAQRAYREQGGDTSFAAQHRYAAPVVEDRVARRRLRRVDTLKARAVTPPDNLIGPYVSRRRVTLFGGHGGTGKTSVALTLMLCGAAGAPQFAGITLKPVRVAFVSFEEEESEILSRMAAIRAVHDLPDPGDRFQVFDGSDLESADLVFERNDYGQRMLGITDLMEELRELATEFDVLCLDNASDCFGLNENDRTHVRFFLKSLARVARAANCAIVLLAHIDKQSAKNGAQGNSYSGSTAWHNTSRSRLALVPAAGDGIELRHEKANFGKKAEPVFLEWFDHHGIGVPVVPRVGGPAPAEHYAPAVLSLLVLAINAGLTITSANSGQATTWHALEALPELPENLRGKQGKKRVAAALLHLERTQRIRRETYRKGTNSREKWVLGDSVSPPIPPAPTECGAGGRLTDPVISGEKPGTERTEGTESEDGNHDD